MSTVAANGLARTSVLGMKPQDLPIPSMQGLSESAAEARLLAEGYNELPSPDRRSLFRIVLEVVKEPMLALLMASGIIYLILGELTDALILIAFAMMSVTITIIQEFKTERVLEALRDLTSPRALVIRGGERRRIAGREVVRGDIVVLAEGDRVPADMLLLSCHDLQADESLLTGESMPVSKVAGHVGDNISARRPGGDDVPVAFSGTLVVRGTGIGEAIATGARSEIGKIGVSLNKLEIEPPRLRAQTRKIVQIFAVLGGFVSLFVVLLYGYSHGSWLDAVLAGISIGMSMLPEEFPVVLAVFMAMGAWRISRARVLSRRAATIETLGSATVLCTDKTGTLTENKMSIVEMRSAHDMTLSVNDMNFGKLSKAFRDLIGFGILASSQEPFDPMDKAFHALGHEDGFSDRGIFGDGRKLVHAYGLRPELLAMTQVWEMSSNKNEYLVATKGAPEAVAGLCRLNVKDSVKLRQSIDTMAAKGMRVLGVASAVLKGKKMPRRQEDFRFSFLGLVGLADPLRASVPEAVNQCSSAGIRVVMITGDYPATAQTIARQAGLNVETVLTGEQLNKLDDAELAKAIRHVNVFARTMPEQKLRIVNALKASGEIVAMTGDGVNDAPSLKAAHIGIAMGKRGTDVAREASSLVLLDDDFGSIVKSVRLGRRIYDNLRKAMGFIMAVHVPIAGMAMLPLVFGLPILFGPAHIAFLELIIDPVCSLVFEAEVEEDDVMRRPPRNPDEPLFSGQMIGWSVVQGAFAFGLVAFIFIVALRQGIPETEVRALTFFSLVMAIVGLIFVNRSFSASVVKALWRPNPSLRWVLTILAVISSLSLLWPVASHLFRFGPLHVDDLALTLGAGLVVLMVLEFVKPIWRRQFQNDAFEVPSRSQFDAP
jgi:P-type Ca2+ transporter type 2C